MKEQKPVVKTLLIIAGTISLGLAILGIVLPLLPTTPFLLLSASCYIRSSKKLYNKLISSKILGNHLKNYYEHRTVSKKVKWTTIIFLWITILLTIIYIIEILWIKILLIGVAIGVSVHIIILGKQRKN